MNPPRAKLRSTIVAALAASLLSLALVPAAIAETDITAVQAAVDTWRADREATILEDFVELLGVRGDVTVDVTTYGATRPLHSGHYGNWSPNPIMQLAHLLVSLRDDAGRILIDNYYDDVVPLGELERDAIANMPDTAEALKDELSVHTPEGDGERIEALISEPAVNVRGISAGGVGEKGRNVIVTSATASRSCAASHQTSS